MENTKEVVLFFNKEVGFNNDEIIEEIKSRYNFLGEAIVTPYIGNVASPIISFISNDNFHVNVGKSYISFLIKEDYFSDIESITFDFVDVFEDRGIITRGLGYVSNVYLDKTNINKIKELYFKEENIGHIDELNVAWYKNMSIDKKDINCWERLITNSRNFDGILIQYDINTAVQNEIEFNMDFIKKFYKKANNYIDKRTKF